MMRSMMASQFEMQSELERLRHRVRYLEGETGRILSPYVHRVWRAVRRR
jgi:hypothetical protein